MQGCALFSLQQIVGARMANADHMVAWHPVAQFFCGRILGHQDRNYSDGERHYAYCLRCGYLFGNPWGGHKGRNTESDTYLGALITEYGNTQFDCGAWMEYEEETGEPYDAVYQRAQDAKRALLEEIARLKLGDIKPGPDKALSRSPSTRTKDDQ